MVIQFPKSGPPGVEYVVIMRDGAAICAMVGPNLVEGIAGFGDTIPQALRDFADNMEKEAWRSSFVF